ncbi:inovirus-type Gp2 protein [Catenovulum sp. SM1970]|uniref:YagK/YfjJ domain-containing protein n=1 Tax=Marinifaba aquimaris TaxID=2741323 RepID=UPI001573C290|nr:inovirus-type Gp2 protein [Marinifaba aquimaris]NTS75694.1 inovirus-type Gp2 protein [Marinifaba aquimaris]
MAYQIKTRFLEVDNELWWVNGLHSGLFSDIAKKMIRQVNAMLSHHSKVLVIRYDLRLYQYTPDNRVITVFNRKLNKWLKAKYQVKRIGFIWCREMEKAKQQHYHYVLMIDGHKVRHPIEILPKVKDIWENNLQGSEYTPKRCYYNLKRDERGSIQRAIWRISYLAKVRSKGNKPAQTKNYGTSRIKQKYR